MAIIEMSGTAGCIEACHGCLNARKLTEKSDISTVVDTAHKIRAAFP